MTPSDIPQHTKHSRSAIATLPESVLIVRLSAMGDVIHGMPAVAALRQARPEMRIGWLIEERWSELLCGMKSAREASLSPVKPIVDFVHTINFAAWRRALLSDETWREARKCLHDVWSRRYDTVIDLQGTIRSAVCAQRTGASARVGSSRPREGLASLFYTRALDVQGEHVVEHALSLVSSAAGQQLHYTVPSFPIDPVREAWAEHFIEAAGGGPIAVVNPGAGWGAKRWPPESFGVVARALHDHGMTLLINHGPGEEALAAAVLAASGDAAHLLKCSVAELIAIIRRACLFIGGDTGPLHLAAALGVPVVALLGPTRPERNGPYGTRSVVLRSPSSVDNASHTSTVDEGLASISPQTVIAAALELLGGTLA